jgi:hypothetical protein
LLLIPGAGPFLNGLVSGVTAGIFTTAFGEAHIATLSHLIRDNPDHHPSPEQIANRLKEELAHRNPFHKKKPHRSLSYSSPLLLEH